MSAQPSLELPQPGASWAVAVRRYFAKYATFSGRASRSEYWWWVLTNAIVGSVLNAFVNMTEPEEWRQSVPFLPPFVALGPVENLPEVLALVFALGTLLPSLAVTWRRLHDVDRSGAWFFIALVPLVGWIVLIVFLAGPSRPAGARFDRVASG